MNIDKSRIIGKAIKDIPKDINTKVQTGDKHREWTKTTTGVINFLSRCTLRYANSYGATYQISQNKELTIVSNKCKSYTLESYTKFLDLIIVDYQDPSEESKMTIKKQSSYKIGDRVKIREDLKTHGNSTSDMCELAGTIVTLTSVKGRRNGYEFKGSGNFHWSADMFEGLVVEDTQPTPADIKVGTHWERLHYLNRHSQKGEIITVSEVDTEYDEINWYNSLGEPSSRDTKDFLENFKPRPDLDSPYTEALQQVDEAFTALSKPKPVASKKEANPKPIKSENTFMSKIKASASATVDQNKQALVIASKMEAGRIINKQVLKQLTPHLPFFLQGYAKSPFAPFVAANLVAMVANHTGNSKLTKVSDLMLLGAADSGVAAFNLDKIVDDILSNIKLPAGILDDNDDN